MSARLNPFAQTEGFGFFHDLGPPQEQFAELEKETLQDTKRLYVAVARYEFDWYDVIFAQHRRSQPPALVLQFVCPKFWFPATSAKQLRVPKENCCSPEPEPMPKLGHKAVVRTGGQRHPPAGKVLLAGNAVDGTMCGRTQANAGLHCIGYPDCGPPI